jgi:CHAT domain-containing protein
VGETITAALKTMGVRGRDAMMRQADRQGAEGALQEDAWTRGCCRLLSTLCACWAWGASDATGAPLRQGTEVEADTAQGRLDAIKRDQEVLGAFYQHLLAPVEAHLAGATEVLIIPHKELFEVPWAALFDSQTGQYLIQRCVLRVAPSLRVARTAADTLRGMNGAEEKGHALVVGNPLPTRSVPLPKAEVEAEFVAELLSGAGFEVHALMRQAATKADVQRKIEGAKWAHLACHGNFDHHSKGPHILLADLSLLPGTFFILYSRFPR